MTELSEYMQDKQAGILFQNNCYWVMKQGKRLIVKHKKRPASPGKDAYDLLSIIRKYIDAGYTLTMTNDFIFLDK